MQPNIDPKLAEDEAREQAEVEQRGKSVFQIAQAQVMERHKAAVYQRLMGDLGPEIARLQIKMGRQADVVAEILYLAARRRRRAALLRLWQAYFAGLEQQRKIIDQARKRLLDLVFMMMLIALQQAMMRLCERESETAGNDGVETMMFLVDCLPRLRMETDSEDIDADDGNESESLR